MGENHDTFTVLPEVQSARAARDRVCACCKFGAGVVVTVALNPQPTGQVSVAGQPMNTIQASIVYDPLVTDEMSANSGELLAHYQVPLIDISNV